MEAAQEWEKEWWGACLHTFGEEVKQLTYAHRMQIPQTSDDGKWPIYDLGGKSVLDIGGGPTSMLLKAINGGHLRVVDPCPYPPWVLARYEAAGIDYIAEGAERHLSVVGYDEVWIYNVLQHVVDPQECIETAKAHGKLLRIFEWVDAETNVGHPHSLSREKLDEWIGGTGTVEEIDENTAYGLAYYGVFPL